MTTICTITFAVFIIILDNSGEIRLDGSDRMYKVGGVTYTVGGRFSDDNVTLKSRLERYIKANASQLTADTSGVIIEEEYVSAVGKENNEQDSR